jgi:hypothetical protein
MLTNETLIEERLADARAIAWDTCHKIYLLMDDEQVEQMREYDYDPLITAEQATPEIMFRWLEKWWAESCSLRFIEAVSTDNDTPNLGFKRHECATVFETLIPQFDEE